MIYRVTHHGKLYGQNWVNRYHYQTPVAGDVPGGAVGLMSAFAANVELAVKNAVAAGMTFERIYVVGLYDEMDFSENIHTPALVGSRAGDAMPPFVAVDFRTDRQRLDIRRGNKRFAGISELDVIGNTWLTPAHVVVVALQVALTEVLDWFPAPADYFQPIIAQYQKYTTPEGNEAYRPYPTELEQRAHSFLPEEWLLYRLTTQRSRQLGHGT